MHPAELRIHRRNTKAFIDADPLDIALSREVREPTPDGGHKRGEDVPVEEQTFRLIPINDQTPVVQTPDGFQRTPTYVLLGEYDADMKIWDKFTLGEHTYQICSPIRPTHTTESLYERKGDVVLI